MIEEEMMFINENRAANAWKYLYINIDKSNVVDYTFPGSSVDAEFPTFLTDEEGEVVKIRLVDNNGQLQLIDNQGNVANVLERFPTIYNDGAVYTIDKFITYK